MTRTHTKRHFPASRRPLVAAGSMLVVLLVVTALPGVAAAAAAESRFLTENSLAEAPKREQRTEPRVERDRNDKSKPLSLTDGSWTPADGRFRPSPVMPPARRAAFERVPPAVDSPPVETHIVVTLRNLPPPTPGR